LSRRGGIKIIIKYNKKEPEARPALFCVCCCESQSIIIHTHHHRYLTSIISSIIESDCTREKATAVEKTTSNEGRDDD
jgi:hypothetical protein